MSQWSPEWRFARMTDAQVNQDPVQGQFFTSESDLPERLVRESIQNSMDARLPGQTVRIRFAFSGAPGALSSAQARPYLDGLERHFEAVNQPARRRQRAMSGKSGKSGNEVKEQAAIYQAAQLLRQPMTYLAVEDFGASGLTGDIRANGSIEPGNDFWGFFRAVGISVKDSTTGGSWGLGKWVFPDASQINSFIALTRRHDESRRLIMGMSVLKTHSIDGDKYPAYGHYAAADSADDFNWIPMPVDSSTPPGAADQINQMIGDFQLERGNDSGLSVVIPWPPDELHADGIARAVVTQYFVPIVRGDLEVEIIDRRGNRRLINNDTIERVLESVDRFDRDDESPESLSGAIRLARWAADIDHDDHYTAWAPTGSSNPFEADADGAPELDLEPVREQFERGERLPIALYLEVQRNEDPAPEGAWFYLYLERDNSLDQGHDYFVRGHLRIPHMDFIKQYNARALLVVEPESALGALLQDAEGPAHADWKPGAQRVRERWAAGARTRVIDVRFAARRLLQRLVERPATLQFDALADLFPAHLAKPVSGPTSEGDTLFPRPPTVPVPPSLTPLMISSRQDGFAIIKHAKATVAGSDWRVRFAYDVARKTPRTAFKRFQQSVDDGIHDFSLYDDQLAIRATACSPEIVGHNELELRIDDDTFEFGIAGFDDRDLVVELTLIESEDGEDQGAA